MIHTLHEAIGAVEAYSPAEERFNRRRRTAGLVLAPLACVATLGASMGFMMPVSTAPNAIVYSSGHVPITAMIRHGLVLDLAAFAVIVPSVLLFGSLLF